MHDPENKLTIESDFDCGSAGEIRKVGEVAYEVDPKPETVPDWFAEALQENFEGAGVPREYSACVRITSDADEALPIRLRVNFTKTCGRNYMEPPYWLRREGRWRPIGATVTNHQTTHVDLRFSVGPGEKLLVANKPYRTPTEVAEEMEDVAAASEGFTIRDIGRTAEDRPIQILETPARKDSIIVGATSQPAEPAARPVLAVAHWLTDGSALTRRLLERFQFCFLPLPNPDGTANGRSCTNNLGEVPMFSYGRIIDGEQTPLETKTIWDYFESKSPSAYMEFHTHYQDVVPHKLNPVGLDCFRQSLHPLVERVDAALSELNAEWRMVTLTRDVPLVFCGSFNNLAERLGTLAYCYQIYSITEESTSAHAIQVISALATALE